MNSNIRKSQIDPSTINALTTEPAEPLSPNVAACNHDHSHYSRHLDTEDYLETENVVIHPSPINGSFSSHGSL